jgi:hypothetical protein
LRDGPALASSKCNNDPLNKFDPLGLAPQDDSTTEVCRAGSVSVTPTARGAYLGEVVCSSMEAVDLRAQDLRDRLGLLRGTPVRLPATVRA